MKILIKIAAFIGVVIFMGLLIGYPTKWLWNGLMPHIFGLTTITFWQAVGLNLLTGFLFGSKSITADKK